MACLVMKEAPRATQVGGSNPCARLVREALDRLATPEVRDRILRDALAEVALAEVPQDPPSFGSFACGALRDAVHRTLGEDEASAVIADLSPAFAQETHGASSGVRRRNGGSLVAPSVGAPVVLIASARAADVDALAARLKERAKVIAAFDVFALLSAAGRHLDASVTVLLHDEMPGVRPSTLATLARVLPPGARIITWGRANVEHSEREPRHPIEWVRLGPVEDIEAVADVCMAMWPSVEVRDEPDEPCELPPRRVVVAHEDASWRTRVSELVSQAGYDVVSATDGFLALERCIEEVPSAVIAGLTMSALDGAQLAALLRSRFGEDAPPVLLVADGPLPDPPPGVMAMIRSDAIDDDLVPELAAWIGPAGS